MRPEVLVRTCWWFLQPLVVPLQWQVLILCSCCGDAEQEQGGAACLACFSGQVFGVPKIDIVYVKPIPLVLQY